MSSAAIAVEALNMTMRLGAFTALDNCSATIKPSSFQALLGEHGASKSTPAKCMMGFYHATSGEMLVDAKEARGTPTPQADIATIGQHMGGHA